MTETYKGPRLPIIAAASIMFFLCLKGGFFGTPGEHFLKISIGFSEADYYLLPAGRFIVLFSLTWITCLAMLLFYPKNISVARSCLLLLFIALLCRAALIPHPPSDDIFRYLWEGRLLNEGISPYKFAPNHPGLAGLAASGPYHAFVNHPYSPAIYPPFMLYVFSLANRIGYSPAAMKIMMILFDLGTIFFLLRILVRRGLDPRWAILYAFNPVVLYGFAGQGHFDAIQNFFVVGALSFYGRKQWAWMFLFAGLAVQSKYIAAIAVPFLVNRENAKYAWIAIFASVAPYFPLIDSEWPLLFRHLIKFGEEYAFNGSIHDLLRGILGGIGPATSVCKLLFACAFLFGLWYFHPERGTRFKNDPVPGCFFSIGALLLLLPTVHFWYLAWIIPFIALTPSKSWMVLCLTISGYFVAVGIHYHTGKWQLPVWARIVEWLPFYTLFLSGLRRFFSRSKHRLDPVRPVSVSVVVPTLDEANRIRGCVESALSNMAVKEVIVVDGGSSDQTVEKAKAAGASVIVRPVPPENGGGRGGQIHAGIYAAKGDVVAVIHADTRILADTFSKILRVLGKIPAIIGGAV